MEARTTADGGILIYEYRFLEYLTAKGVLKPMRTPLNAIELP